MKFTLSPLANVGNRMLAYMVAQAVAQRLGGPVSFNVGLPEWGLELDQALHHQALADPALCRFDDAGATTLDEMAARIAASGGGAVVFHGFFQRFFLLREVEFYRALFPVQPLDIPPFAENEIVINIRAGELLTGFCSWYPLVPPSFYRALIDRTGWRPVLLGQVEDSLYMREILRLCPEARLIPSGGAMVDFNRLRHAKRLCIAVSTFSWLAAWLSEAVEIHYPVLGFLHPFCQLRGTHDGGGVELTPVGDERYRYHMLPMLNAEPELEYLRYVSRLNPVSLPAAPALMAGLAARAARMTSPRQGQVEAARWYLRQYPEAAWSLALGQYDTAQEHYEQLGRAHGYQRSRLQRLEWRRERTNLALGKPALQSSVSEWSRQPTPEGDAAGAVSGIIDEQFAFHTGLDNPPWWRVDLGQDCRIDEIWLFNRIEQEVVAMRAARLAVDIGASEAVYVEAFRREADAPFGGTDGEPLVIRFPRGISGRYVRIRLLRRDFLHLAQVEVYGAAL